jgi:Fe-S-cluster containining protein
MDRLDAIREEFRGIISKSNNISKAPMCDTCDKDYCCTNRTDIDITDTELEYYKTLKSKKLRKRFKQAILRKKKKGTFTCPFLEDGRCSIYDKRPLSCASFFAFKDNDDSTPEQCLDVNGYHNIITLAQFTPALVGVYYLGAIRGHHSILDVY